jgi:hypothetical protein
MAARCWLALDLFLFAYPVAPRLILTFGGFAGSLRDRGNRAVYKEVGSCTLKMRPEGDVKHHIAL